MVIIRPYKDAPFKTKNYINPIPINQFDTLKQTVTYTIVLEIFILVF